METTLHHLKSGSLSVTVFIRGEVIDEAEFETQASLVEWLKEMNYPFPGNPEYRFEVRS